MVMTEEVEEALISVSSRSLREIGREDLSSAGIVGAEPLLAAGLIAIGRLRERTDSSEVVS